ncbi:DUF4148 domain-containing protein [Bordetella trematum]|uniref:DUF4148 domain-containing protein n=1 Tax=Bordetella trematum TaxID=123899 RepID=UPI003988E974
MKVLTSALLMSMAVIAGGAHASDNTEPNNTPYDGVYGRVDANAKTRAQVLEELAQAKANGQYTFGELDYPAAQPVTSTKTRAQVREELAQAKANGEYTFGELDYPPHSN